MPKDHDFFVNARRVVEQAIGEHMDGTPLKDANAGKDPKAIARGRKGGNRGGKIVVTGTPEAVAKCKESYTGKWLGRILYSSENSQSNGNK